MAFLLYGTKLTPLSELTTILKKRIIYPESRKDGKWERTK